jgi:hypothetical protein
MNNWGIAALIVLVIAIIIGNILLIKKSAKFGLKNKDGTPASSKDLPNQRKDNNAHWDDD